MIRLEYTDTFLKDLKSLPDFVKAKLKKQIFLLAKNPFHSKLHTKPLKGGMAGQYSFRITRDYRALFIFTAPEIVKLKIFLIKQLSLI